LKVNLFSLTAGVPETFEHSYDPEALELNAVDWEIIEPLVLRGELEKIEGALTVHGKITSRVREICSRCLARLEHPYEQGLSLTLIVESDQGALDFTPEVREEVLLSHPVKYLCSESCKGLCPGCGANLNVTRCDCRPEKKVDSPFDVLKKIKKKDGE